MKTCLAVSLVTGCLAMSPFVLMAQTPTNNVTPNVAQLGTTKSEKGEKGQQRRQILVIVGIAKGDLKGLSRQDRTAKIKEAADKMIAKLEKKQEASALTDKEQSDLALLKKFELHAKAHAKPKADS